MENECEAVDKQCSKFKSNTVVVLTGKNATVKQVGDRLPQCRLLHVACHAVTLPNETIPDALALSDDSIIGSTAATNINDNMNSLLTAKMIQDKNLSGMELAFLNCCFESAVYNEGLVGLARSFIFAGAQAVVLSTKPVIDDETTCTFVDLFYENYFKAEVKNVEMALCRAQRACLKRNIDPKYWASHIVLRGSDN